MAIQASKGTPQELTTLRHNAKITRCEVRTHLGALRSRAFAKYKWPSNALPMFAKAHILATRQLDEAVINAERNPAQKISSTTLTILRRSKAVVRKLAAHVHYPSYLQLIASHTPESNTHGLLVGSTPPAHQIEWSINLGLLTHLYYHTADPKLKKQLGFLAIHYLAKAAPFGERTGVDRQLGFFIDQTYHRSDNSFEKYLAPIFQKMFHPESDDNLLLADTKECQSVFSVFYTVIDMDNVATWSDQIAKAMNDYVKEGDFSEFLSPPILFDCTETIGDSILHSSTEDRFYLFRKTLDQIELKIEGAIDQAAKKIRQQQRTTLSDEQLKSVIRCNITCVSRHEISNIGVIKLLPILQDYMQFKSITGDDRFAGVHLQEIKKYRRRMLAFFADYTGIRLGAVQARRILFEHYELNTFIQHFWNLPVEYAPKGHNTMYFPKKTSLIDSQLFQNFASTIEKHYENMLVTHPHYAILGKATVNVCKGLLNEISENTWEQLNHHSDTRELIQTLLFRFTQHLAQADNTMRRDLAKTSAEAQTAFVQSIELAQAELSSLLEIFSPFDENDFTTIYKKQLTHIPEKLQSYVRIGAGKSAMNVFSGIHAAVCRTKNGRSPQCVIGKNSYYEEVALIGQRHSVEKTLQDTHVKGIDLYIDEFHHNINIDPAFTHYKPTDIIDNVKRLLRHKLQTQCLTIAVDNTIDCARSTQVAALLTHFSEDIEKGRINIVIFRSGQKFDMLGMDNYYGAPFYVLNNGKKQWKEFDHLTTDPLFQTDPLSMQWFCLANKYAFQEMEDYRRAIFQNTRSLLDQVPEILKPGQNTMVHVCTVEKSMEPCFIDIKLLDDRLKDDTLTQSLSSSFHKNGRNIYPRLSFGFQHSSYTKILSSDDTTWNTRITLGLNPADITIIADYFNTLAEWVKLDPL